MLNNALECLEKDHKTDFTILKNFCTNLSKNPKCPKKEYLRCKLIRGHKRAIRQIKKGIIPKTTLHKFDLNNRKSLRIWNEMIKIFENHTQIFLEISKTESGPNTDGKAKRKSSSTKIEKSFNSAFCKKYFLHEEVRRSYFFYVQLLFVEFDIMTLISKFQFRCCREDVHSVNCIQNWIGLKNYITEEMIVELELIPFILDYYPVSLPSFIDLLEF